MKRTLVIWLLAAGCASDDPAPTVTILSASPHTLIPANDLADDLRILTTYEDSDGDLGGGFARVQDCRVDALVSELEIPLIAPPDLVAEGAAISGSLDLNLTDVGAVVSAPLPSVCSDLGVEALALDTTVFCVVLVDAKDHAGPGDCTDVIAISP